jgi:hypothetical protein
MTNEKKHQRRLFDLAAPNLYLTKNVRTVLPSTQVPLTVNISALSTLLSLENKLNFEEIASEMRLAFLKADKDELMQEQVFEVLVEKIRGGNRSLTISACEAVIAFFVQDCEVFNVTAK